MYTHNTVILGLPDLFPILLLFFHYFFSFTFFLIYFIVLCSVTFCFLYSFKIGMQNSVWETGSLSSFTLVAWMLLGPLLSCLATTIICAEEGSQTDHFITEAGYIIFIIQ